MYNFATPHINRTNITADQETVITTKHATGNVNDGGEWLGDEDGHYLGSGHLPKQGGVGAEIGGAVIHTEASQTTLTLCCRSAMDSQPTNPRPRSPRFRFRACNPSAEARCLPGPQAPCTVIQIPLQFFRVFKSSRSISAGLTSELL